MNTTSATRFALTERRCPAAALPTIEALCRRLAEIERAYDAADLVRLGVDADDERGELRRGAMEAEAVRSHGLVLWCPGLVAEGNSGHPGTPLLRATWRDLADDEAIAGAMFTPELREAGA